MCNRHESCGYLISFLQEFFFLSYYLISDNIMLTDFVCLYTYEF